MNALNEFGPNKKIVILSGAGISQESGIATFRDSNGLWENHPVEKVATYEAFIDDPNLVQNFYNARRAQLLDPKIKPNRAHLALAKLEKEYSGDVVVVTQNVDNLHERAGSQKLLHMHGELLKMRCQTTENIFDITEDILPESICPCCKKTQNLRPHIVWFGEMPLYMDEIQLALLECDLFIAVGTSGTVYPAAQFVTWVKSRDKTYAIEVNPKATDIEDFFDEKIRRPAGEACEQIVEGILNSRPI